MLKKVEFLNYNTSYAYCPPVEETVINTDHITNAVPCESRYSGKTMTVRFIDGTHLTVVGEPKDLL